MYHAIHILLCIFVSLQFLDHGSAADKTSTATNVGSVLSPVLLKGLQDSRPIRTAITEAIGASSVPATTTPKPKMSRTTSKPKRGMTTTRKPRTSESSSTANDKLKFKPEQRPEYPNQDSAKAAQQIRPDQFPFDFRNGFGFPGAGGPGASGPGGQNFPRDFNPGFFGDQAGPGGFNQGNPGFFRPFDASNAPSGSRGGDNTIQGNDGRNPADPSFNGINRPFESAEGFDRFRDFGRYPFAGGFPGQFPAAFDPRFRGQDDRFRFSNYPAPQGGQGQGAAGNFGSNDQSNFRQDLRTNFPNSLNDQRSFAQFPGSFPFQGYTPNNFDFLPNQRFQNSFGDSFRGLQGQSNLFYPGGSGGAGPGVSRPVPPSSGVNGGNSSNGSAAGPRTSASNNSEKLENPSGPASKSPIQSEASGVDFRGQKLFYPQLEDYSDLRFRPDGFLINSNIAAKRGISGKA